MSPMSPWAEVVQKWRKWHQRGDAPERRNEGWAEAEGRPSRRERTERSERNGANGAEQRGGGSGTTPGPPRTAGPPTRSPAPELCLPRGAPIGLGVGEGSRGSRLGCGAVEGLLETAALGASGGGGGGGGGRGGCGRSAHTWGCGAMWGDVQLRAARAAVTTNGGARNPGGVRGSTERVLRGFRRADFELIGALLGTETWEKAREGREAQEGRLVFRAHLLRGRKQCIPRKRKAGKDTGRLLWVNEERLDSLKLK